MCFRHLPNGGGLCSIHEEGIQDMQLYFERVPPHGCVERPQCEHGRVSGQEQTQQIPQLLSVSSTDVINVTGMINTPWYFLKLGFLNAGLLTNKMAFGT